MMITEKFSSRHIGPDRHETEEMLAAIGVSSVDELISQTVPSAIRLKKPIDTGIALSEFEYKKHISSLAKKNKLYRSFIGLGYYDTITPSVIQRNILENPGWYTAYTPYQAEIAQGRLEALLNFQTMVIDLTGLPVANASLLDEGTAAAEAMTLMLNSRSREAVKNEALEFFVSEKCFPQTIDILHTRANVFGIKLVIGDHNSYSFTGKTFGALLQYPAGDGTVYDYTSFIEKAHSAGALVAVAADILSLTLLKSPGEMGADVAVGSTQRFGVPMGYGGPHAAFFATRDEFKRLIPGRIIGVSVDSTGKQAYRMALQTREQHIKRDKATSNICTAQALLAIMASMYAVYHGPQGLEQIASGVHSHARLLASSLSDLGLTVRSNQFFDTITVDLPANITSIEVREAAEKNGINFRYGGDAEVGISLDETVTIGDINNILSVFSTAGGKKAKELSASDLPRQTGFDPSLRRTSNFLLHPVFNTHHSETEMMRYIKRLENRDLSLTHSMIPLGSCTMKLNAASELYPITYPEFAGMHPFVPRDQAQGYAEVIRELEKDLAEITGFAGISLQPNSGAQGEYAGLMVIREYHISRGEGHRDVALIPSSAHGTNPASAAMAGMKIVVTRCDENGNVDIEDLRQKAEQHKDKLSCLMVTYPSTHGVFEEGIQEITQLIHSYGGQVYMDGANMNAQVGLTNPASIGADVCHLNLHKTFAIPHGGGGPGMGPIGVAKHLVPFLPSHPVIAPHQHKGTHAISAAPWGSALILLISYGYIKMLGSDGLKRATEMAIVNANYLKARLENHYPVLYLGSKGRVAHEMIVDCRSFKKDGGIEVEDIAKRLIDYGFHAPTVSFPVAGTLMIEPTESEPKEELDRFAEAMISIRKEIEEVITGQADKTDNVLKNAPHSLEVVVTDNWKKSYSREKAAYPISWIHGRKFWPSVGRIDNAFGDRNLICSCPPIEAFEEEHA